MSKVLMLTHFHREFPFNFDSSWLKASYAGGTEAYEWKPPTEEGEYTNVTTRDFIFKYRHYYGMTTENNFLRAMGQQVTDYYLANLDTDAEYLGVASYRRYLDPSSSNPELKITMPANLESCKYLSSDEQEQAILKHLETADVLTNRTWTMHTSIENQYLESQLKEYWDLFKEGIVHVNPTYKPYMNWFDGNRCNYEGVYITRKDLFRKLVSEYFLVMEYIWKRCSQVYPSKDNQSYSCSEPLPWRYPGFLNERFVPFFFHANNLKQAEVPLVFLN